MQTAPNNLRVLDRHAPLFEPAVGRPGDWSEPFALPIARRPLTDEAKRLGLAPSLLAALLLERALVLRDIRVVSRSADEQLRRLDSAAATELPVIGPGCLNFSYRRSLSGAGSSAQEAPDAPLAIPLRLHERARDVDEHELSVESARQALQWEIAATADGRFMSEWALLVILGR